jgi:hypothetical protein
MGGVSYIIYSTEVLFHETIKAVLGISAALLHLLLLKYLYSDNTATVRIRGLALLCMRQKLY